MNSCCCFFFVSELKIREIGVARVLGVRKYKGEPTLFVTLTLAHNFFFAVRASNIFFINNFRIFVVTCIFLSVSETFCIGAQFEQ